MSCVYTHEKHNVGDPCETFVIDNRARFKWSSKARAVVRLSFCLTSLRTRPSWGYTTKKRPKSAKPCFSLSHLCLAYFGVWGVFCPVEGRVVLKHFHKENGPFYKAPILSFLWTQYGLTKGNFMVKQDRKGSCSKAAGVA